MRVDEGSNGRAPSHLIRLIVESYCAFDPHARRQVMVLLFLTAVMAFLEALGAALVVPFVAMLNDPNYLTVKEPLRVIFAMSPFHTPEAFIVGSSLALFIFFVTKNLLSVWILNAQFSFVYGKMPDFSCRLFQSYMGRSLAQYGESNSSELIRNVTSEVSLYFTNFLIPTLTLLTEALVLMAIVGVLLVIAPLPSVIAIVLLGGMTKFFYVSVRARVSRYGQEAQHDNAERIKWVNQGLNTFKEAKILGCENFFIQRFNFHETRFAVSSQYAMLLNQTPRLFIETLAFSALFLGVALALVLGRGQNEVLPVLALFAVAAIRLLPSLNRIMLSITRMAYYRSAAQVVLRNCQLSNKLGKILPQAASRRGLGGWKELRFKDVCFSYPGSVHSVFRDVNLNIIRGTSVALIGPSGSGKTTLADMALGLLAPTSGKIEVDGQDISVMMEDWQAELGYIPQSVYLLDDTIRHNVAFGVPHEHIDDLQVWKVLQQASLDDFVRSLPEQLNSQVGENGNRLSGGQRQRLGIARALYRDPEFIVLDEATSALDEETEKDIAEALAKITGIKTLLVISHRPESINRCNHRFSVLENRFV